MFTEEGTEWLGEWIAGELQNGAWIVVADGQGESAVATITEAKYVTRDDGSTVVECVALFDEQNANFEWTKRSVKLNDGKIIDREVEDMGRKKQGSVWTIKVSIDVGTSGGD